MTSTATPQTLMERGEFQNEAFVDFSTPENRKSMEDALRRVKEMFGREYPLIIDGKKITTTDKITSTNPSHPEEVIGIFQKASVEMAKQAVDAADRAFEKWRKF
jgi:1-pyrroline-5-carboxylate dehydrogenase